MMNRAGKFSLHDCVRRGDLDQLTTLLKAGSLPDELDDDRWTPLCKAAWLGHTEMVEVLIQYRANVNVRNKHRETILHTIKCACQAHNDIVNMLIQHGTDVSAEDTCGETPLHKCAFLGYDRTANILISHGADVNVMDKSNRTPLHYSAMTGVISTVELLVKNLACVDSLDRIRFTPLMWAERYHQTDIVYILRKAKSIQAGDKTILTPVDGVSIHFPGTGEVQRSINYATPKDTPVSRKIEAGRLSVHDCVKRGDLDMLTKLLNEGRSHHGRDEDRWTPLCRSAWLGHTEMVDVLVSNGADVAVQDKYGGTPLHKSVTNGHKEMTEILINHGADVNAQDVYRSAPLHKSAMFGYKEIVQILIKHKANVNVKDKYGWTPLHLCAYEGHTEIANILISHGADVNAKDNCGWTALHKSAVFGHKECVDILVQHQADVNVKSEPGQTPLHRSACQGHKEILKDLISHGAVVNMKDKFGQTPLHVSVRNGHKEIADILIRYGASVNAKDYYKQTSLHFCARLGYKEAAKSLIHRGADINAKDNDGRTPLMQAELSGHKDIAHIFSEAKIVKPTDGRIWKVIAGFFGYSSSTRRVSIQSSTDKGEITEVKCENTEVIKEVATICDTFEHVGEGKPEKVKAETRMDNEDGGVQEFASASTKISTCLTTSETDAFTSDELSSGPVTSKPPTSESPLTLTSSTQILPTTPSSSSSLLYSTLPLTSSSTRQHSASQPPPLHLPLTTPPDPLASVSQTTPASSLASATPSLAAAPTSNYAQTSWSPTEPRDEVIQLAQSLLKAVKSRRKCNEDVGGVSQNHDSLTGFADHLDGNVIVINNKTVNNHYHNHYYNNNNKQVSCEEVEVETSQMLDVSVGSLQPSEGDDHVREDESGYICETGEDKETGREEINGHIFAAGMIDKSYVDLEAKEATKSTSKIWLENTNTVTTATTLVCSEALLATTSTVSSPSTTTTTKSSLPSRAATEATAAEIRRRLESQAGYMEKMVQSCVAGGGVGQDQSSDLATPQHIHVPFNLNFIMQPKNVEVHSTKQVNCEKVDVVEKAEIMASHCQITYDYGPQKSSDDEVSTDDDNSEDKEVHIEDISD